MAKFLLTDEGMKYAREGLPEKRLIEILDKPLQVNEAKNRIENFDIALLWAKKNSWVRIDSGNLVLVKKPPFIPEQEALKAIVEGKSIDQRMLDNLLKRNLVAEEREDIYKIAEKQISQKINKLTPELVKTGLWKKLETKPYNVSATGKKIYPGKPHPYNQFLHEVRQKLVQLGFKEMRGPLIELEFWNFDALYQAQNHPSRDWTQTYSLKNPDTGLLPSPKLVNQVKLAHESGLAGYTGWGYKWDQKKSAKLMPRAHGTACSARQLASGVEIPGKYFAISRCFRPDVIDAMHGVEFNQCEGIVIDPSLTFRHMLGLLKSFVIEIAGAEKVKFYPDYYPFTEGSIQVSAYKKETGWMELAGAGIFRPEVILPLGIKEPVIAWGFGIDRLAMFKLGINDIRFLFTRNLDWLRKQKAV